MRDTQRTEKQGARRVGALVGSALLLLTTAACAEEPRRESYPEETSVVRVAIDSLTVEQWVMGELYMRVLVKSGREAVPFLPGEDAATKNALDSLIAGKADLVIGCAGEMLTAINPREAKKLADEYAVAREQGLKANDGEWREKVYAALLNSLPGQLGATDPSNAMGCQDEDDHSLPQNVVPVYRKPVLNRDERMVLNSVTGTITTDELSELVDEVEHSGSASAVIENYIASHGL